MVLGPRADGDGLARTRLPGWQRPAQRGGPRRHRGMPLCGAVQRRKERPGGGTVRRLGAPRERGGGVPRPIQDRLAPGGPGPESWVGARPSPARVSGGGDHRPPRHDLRRADHLARRLVGRDDGGRLVAPFESARWVGSTQHVWHELSAFRGLRTHARRGCGAEAAHPRARLPPASAQHLPTGRLTIGAATFSIVDKALRQACNARTGRLNRDILQRTQPDGLPLPPGKLRGRGHCLERRGEHGQEGPHTGGWNLQPVPLFLVSP